MFGEQLMENLYAMLDAVFNVIIRQRAMTNAAALLTLIPQVLHALLCQVSLWIDPSMYSNAVGVTLARHIFTQRTSHIDWIVRFSSARPQGKLTMIRSVLEHAGLNASIGLNVSDSKCDSIYSRIGFQNSHRILVSLVQIHL